MKRYALSIIALCITLFMLCSCAKDDPTKAPAPDAQIDLSAMSTGASASAVSIEGNVITVKSAGVYRIFGSSSDARIVVDSDKKADVTLLFDNATLICSGHAPIYAKKANNVIITTKSGTSSIIENKDGYSKTAGEEDNVDSAVFSKCDIVFEGEGSLKISCSEGNAVSAKDDLVVGGGEITATAPGHAFEVNDSIKINGGSLTLSAGKDTLHTKNADDPKLGIFEMNGGTLELSAEDDAIRAVASITVNGGSINARKCDEGFKAEQIFINGGEISITASADGINAKTDAADPSTVVCKLHITNGNISIISNEDAIDSNGSVTIDGGEVIIYGPEKLLYGSGALDYGSTATINGGKFIAFTCPGKAFSEDSTQAFLALNLAKRSEAADVVIRDDAGNVIYEGRAKIPFNSVQISSPEIQVGKTYTVSIGAKEIKVTQNELITKIKES